jgi:hypothetical protein
MQAYRLSGILLGAALLIGLGDSAALAQSCQDLWVARNSIYKTYGYCFKTARAIRYFGNAGCQYDSERELPLSRADRARINRIVAEERENGC